MKVYTTAESGDGFVPATVIAALGDQPHHRQAQVYIWAASKAAAAAATGDRWNPRQLKVAHGNTAEAIGVAIDDGRLTPGVYAVSHNQPNGPVVAFGQDGAVAVVGRLHRDRATGGQRFLAAGEDPRPPPDAARPVTATADPASLAEATNPTPKKGTRMATPNPERAEFVWEYGIFDPVGHEPMAVVHSDAEVRGWLTDRRIQPGTVRVERRKVSDWAPAPGFRP